MQLIQDICQEENLLLNIAKETLNLSKNRVSEVEVCIKKTIGISVNVRNSIVENIAFNSDGALFITVYNKFSKGSVSLKHFSVDSIKNMLDIAINISKYSSSDFFSGLPDENLLFSDVLDLDLFHPEELNIKNAIKYAILTEQEAFKFDKRITNSEGSFFSNHLTINIFGNSLGMLETYKSTRYSAYNCVIAQDKNYMERDFDYSISRKTDFLKSPEILGRKSAERAISRLGSQKIRTMKSPIIFSSEISHMLFSHLFDAIHGNNVYRRSTFLINDLNKKIFPEWINIHEDPHVKQGLGSRPFDDEGVSTRYKDIIKNGILKTWLLNSYNARKLNLISTGNCGDVYNWFISFKDISFEELLRQMDNGLLVTELMGQGVDIVSGNYSRGAIGFWVKNGKIAHPVNEITISGNLRNIWRSILSISNDIDTRNDIQCGSILLENMQISGY
ncbi:MAG: metalloprotease PmbA [Buchnera aphidicola (Pentalonia nigronervosa)]|jgi:PmbA protein|uniref:Metalloprotease PmbA n=1 Tax=Buchnera aphidicola (Pentalonia nigronervosa) TaxID=1309793 RepID=A0A7H1AZC7_9GAMM|nr:MAG: metalloprotease PmbA [Buchnera aphidicola (Pentalonia nigronervosa)]